MNIDDNVKVYMRAQIDDSAMNKHIRNIARDLADNIIKEMPNMFEDVLTMSVVMRPNGTRYTIVDFV